MATKTRSRTTTKIIPVRAPKPIVIRTIQAKPVKRAGKRRHPHGGGGGAARGLTDPKRLGVIVGGFAVGMLQKQNLPLPKLPFVGEAGTIGLAAYFISDGGKNKLADEICTAALTIAAFQLGSTGQVVGAEDEDVDESEIGYVAG